MLQATKRVIPDNNLGNVRDLVPVIVETTPIQITPTMSRVPAAYDKYRSQMNTISFGNSAALDKFGESDMSKLSVMTSSVEGELKLKNMGEVGEKVTQLIKTAKELDPSVLLSNQKPGFFAKMLGKVTDPIETFAVKQLSVKDAIGKITIKLKDDRQALIGENTKLEKIFAENQKFVTNMNDFIEAGMYRLDELKFDLERMKAEIQSKSNPTEEEISGIQQAQNYVDRFERRISRLNDSKAIMARQLIQIRIMQDANSKEAETIGDCINTAIPAWEQQMQLYISQLRTKTAAENERAVTSMINDTITKNAELMYQNTVEIANAMNNPLIKIETIQAQQNMLIQSFDVLNRAAEEGRRSRQDTFLAIARMDEELKAKLLSNTVA